MAPDESPRMVRLGMHTFGLSCPLRRPPFLNVLLAITVAACSPSGAPVGPQNPVGAPGPGADSDSGDEPEPGPAPDPLPADPAPPDTTSSGEVLVRLRPGVRIEAIDERYGTTTLDVVTSLRVYLLGLPAGADIGEVLADMDADADLEAASPNVRLSVPEAQSRSTMAFADPALDPVDREDQQGIHRIRAPEAWAWSRGDGVIVAVLDTGVDVNHPQLRRHIAGGGADLVDDDLDPADLPDGMDNDHDGLVDEAVGHGTFIAGLVLAVAPAADILPVRILDSDGTGHAIDIARGIEVAVTGGARVINLSLGMEVESLVVQKLIEEEVRRRDVVFVASAGNHDTSERQFPAGQEDVMGVAATDLADRKADFSNWGPWVSLSAPGAGLVSALPEAAMGHWSGTSFSSALVSGAGAVLFGLIPTAGPEDVRSALEETAVYGGDSRLVRARRIDVEAAARLLAERFGEGADSGGDPEPDLEIEILGIVVSVDLLGRTVRLKDGTVVEIPNDGLIDGTGDLVSLTVVAAAVTLGLEVRATGLALQIGSALEAIQIRFDLL